MVLYSILAGTCSIISDIVDIICGYVWECDECSEAKSNPRLMLMIKVRIEKYGELVEER